MKLFTDQILNIPIDDIKPNKINPNKMPPPTFEKLKLSLKKFGQLNPIIVRIVHEEDEFPGGEGSTKIFKYYEIIDGEWRYKASIEIGLREVQCKVIEATSEEVAGLIFASTIRGKHDVYHATDLIEKLAETETSDSLKAMNLDKAKVERKTKYHGSDKIKVVARKERGMKDEKDSGNVKSIDKFKQMIMLSEAPKHCKIEAGKVVLK